MTFGELVKDEIVEQTFEALMGTLTLWQQFSTCVDQEEFLAPREIGMLPTQIREKHSCTL